MWRLPFHGWGSGPNEKENVNGTQAFIFLCFLTIDNGATGLDFLLPGLHYDRLGLDL